MARHTITLTVPKLWTMSVGDIFTVGDAIHPFRIQRQRVVSVTRTTVIVRDLYFGELTCHRIWKVLKRIGQGIDDGLWYVASRL